MLDLARIKNLNLITQTSPTTWQYTPVDKMGIDDALEFIKQINRSDHLHIADKTASLSRYSRIGLTITPTYVSIRGNNQNRRRSIHPFGLIQYITASILIAGNTFNSDGALINCAKARDTDVFYGSLCFYIKELDNLRTVLPMGQRDTLNISKLLDGKTVQQLPQFNMGTEIASFEKLREVYIKERIWPDYQQDVEAYTLFWEMMYYRTFAGCFTRYMPMVLDAAINR